MDSTIRDQLDLPQSSIGLQIFVDGCYEPMSRRGGWAFVVYRYGVEIASAFGGASDTANNAMEIVALLRALTWVNKNAGGELATVWTDSAYAVRGCNIQLPIWRSGGWRKRRLNGQGRSRAVEYAECWKAIDMELSRNPALTIAWCKGHSGIEGNERADDLAETGRLTFPAL